jgi:hypothetical protein
MQFLSDKINDIASVAVSCSFENLAAVATCGAEIDG